MSAPENIEQWHRKAREMGARYIARYRFAARAIDTGQGIGETGARSIARYQGWKLAWLRLCILLIVPLLPIKARYQGAKLLGCD